MICIKSLSKHGAHLSNGATCLIFALYLYHCPFFVHASSKGSGKNVGMHILQGSHRLEKYLNIQDCLEKSLKIKFPLKYLKNTQRP